MPGLETAQCVSDYQRPRWRDDLLPKLARTAPWDDSAPHRRHDMGMESILFAAQSDLAIAVAAVDRCLGLLRVTADVG